MGQMGELSVPTTALDLTLGQLRHALIGIMRTHTCARGSKGGREERTRKESIRPLYFLTDRR